MNKKSILIVEDEATIALDIEMRLTRLGFNVCDIVQKANLVISSVEQHQPDLVLMDINLKGKEEGIDLAEEIYLNNNLPVVFLTAFTDNETFQKANQTHTFGFYMQINFRMS